MPTADEYTTNIQNAMKTPNYLVVSTTRKGEEDKIFGWLNLPQDTPHLDRSAFEAVCNAVFEYEVDYFYAENTLKDRISNKTLSASDAVRGLNGGLFEDIVKALQKLAEGLGGDQGSRVGDIARQLDEEFKVLCSTVEREIKESHEKMEVGHYNVSTGSSASAAPSSHQPGGDGYRLVKLVDYTDTANNKATWEFGLRCVNKDEDAYVLPVDDEKLEWHWRLDKDEPVVVEVEDADQPKTTKAPDNFAPNKDRIAKPEDDTDFKRKFVEGILEKWPVKDKKWYPLAGPSTDSPPPDSHKIPINEKEKDGYVWTFNMAWVDKDEEMYLKKDDPKKDHLVVAKGEKVVVALKEDDDVKKETQLSDRLPLPEGADEGGDTAIEELFKDGGKDKWYPKEPSTEAPAPDTHKIRVSERVNGEYMWTFSMAYVDKDDRLFVKRQSDRKHHLSIPTGEKIVVSRADRKGDPKETITDKWYNLDEGADENGDAAIADLLKDIDVDWFPASLEDQQSAKDAAEAQKRVDDAANDVKAKIKALQQGATKLKAFVPAYLRASQRRGGSAVPADFSKASNDWGTVATDLGGLSNATPDPGTLENMAQHCRDLLDFVKQKGAGDEPNEVTAVLGQVQDLEESLAKYRELQPQ